MVRNKNQSHAMVSPKKQPRAEGERSACRYYCMPQMDPLNRSPAIAISTCGPKPLIDSQKTNLQNFDPIKGFVLKQSGPAPHKRPNQDK